MIKPIALFLLLCLVGLIPAYKVYEFASKTCDATNQALTLNQPEAKQNNAKTETLADNQQGSWSHNFWCRATVTDFAIAYFTYCLVLVGVFGMWSAERLTRDSERAHIFPDMIPTLAGGHVQIIIAPKNSGRNAGVQREVFGDFALKRPWGILPYTGGSLITADQVIEAGQRSPATAGFSSRVIGPQFFFGYVGYMDFFHRRHKTYFCVRAVPTQNGVLLHWADDDLRSRWLNRFH